VHLSDSIAFANPNVSSIWFLTGALVVLALVGAILLAVVARRFLHHRTESMDDFGTPKPRSENPTAFMTASMQAVIQKLRDQEKELEVLHRAERERAQQTERLSEAVTHNMPAGLLLVNSAGLVTSANPAAELALGAVRLRGEDVAHLGMAALELAGAGLMEALGCAAVGLQLWHCDS